MHYSSSYVINYSPLLYYLESFKDYESFWCEWWWSNAVWRIPRYSYTTTTTTTTTTADNHDGDCNDNYRDDGDVGDDYDHNDYDVTLPPFVYVILIICSNSCFDNFNFNCCFYYLVILFPS